MGEKEVLEELSSDRIEKTCLRFDRLFLDLSEIKNRLFNQPEGEYKDLFDSLKEITKEIALAKALCRCEKCGREDRLTIHHLVTRQVKRFTSFNKYLLMRYHWKNILVLCCDCHTEFHKNEKEWEQDLTPICQWYVDKIRERYVIHG